MKVIEGYLSYEDTIRQAVSLAAELSDKNPDEDSDKITAPIRQKIISLQAEIDGITAFIAKNGSSAPASLMDKLENLDEQIARARHEQALIRQSYAKPDADRIIRVLRDAANIKNRPPEEQKALIQQAVRAVIVTDDMYRVLIHDCTDDPTDDNNDSNCTLSGGDEGNRTPVRRFRPMVFSERSLAFKFPSPGRRGGRLLGLVASFYRIRLKALAVLFLTSMTPVSSSRERLGPTTRH